VRIDGVSAGLEITQPREIAVYVQAFAHHQRAAVYGAPARELVQRALADLER
jgi:hypothetical protein